MCFYCGGYVHTTQLREGGTYWVKNALNSVIVARIMCTTALMDCVLTAVYLAQVARSKSSLLCTLVGWMKIQSIDFKTPEMMNIILSTAIVSVLETRIYIYIYSIVMPIQWVIRHIGWDYIITILYIVYYYIIISFYLLTVSGSEPFKSFIATQSRPLRRSL